MNTLERKTLIASEIMAAFGDLATYMPIVGSVSTVTARVRRRSRIIDGFGATQINADGQIIEIQKSSLTIEPRPGDLLSVLGVEWRVRSVRQRDAADVQWLLDCVPD